MKAHGLQDLKKVRQALLAQRELERAQQAALEAEKKKREADQQLFARAVGAVSPLPDRKQARIAPAPTLPLPRQLQQDEAAALRDSLSDEFDVSTLLDTDDALSFRRPGVGPDITRKLRKGDWSIQREIDLHGLRSDEARIALAGFIREAHRMGLRCVRVVHGKGLGSPGKTPVLKNKVHSWLVQKSQVMAFVQAKPSEGGAGALVVLLTPGG
jgi:DNA-nicking Smr family endonuclease